MTTTEAEPATDEELDAACEAMRPAAQRLVGAVRLCDAGLVRAAFAEAQAVDVPLGRSPLGVLALVLADEVGRREENAVARATRAERERCLQLTVEVVRMPPARTFEGLKRLPQRISRGDQP